MRYNQDVIAIYFTACYQNILYVRYSISCVLKIILVFFGPFPLLKILRHQ